MSGGTTGRSRPTLYTAWDREAGAILTARALYMQGIRPGDVVINAWAYSTHNGAHAMDEALYRWLNCVVLSTGTGNVTPTRKQVELAVEYNATAILTTGDYLLHLADTARDMGLDPAEDLTLTALPNIGDKQRLNDTFGVPVYDSYGFHEVQWVAIECPAGEGMHIFEDAFIVQIVDVETGELLPDGEQGAICITEIYKTGSPQFRYNIMDLSTLHPPGQCSCGSWLRKMAPFAGRGDNMVKLRGVNIWPEALGEIVTAVDGVTDDYFVRATRDGNRDEMTVMVVSDRAPGEFDVVRAAATERLHEVVGVKIGVQVVSAGELDQLTGFGSVAKLVRFKDER
jgi:phenylacetate-CoA ligase